MKNPFKKKQQPIVKVSFENNIKLYVKLLQSDKGRNILKLLQDK